MIIVPSHHTATGANSLELRERYDIITDEEWYICGYGIEQLVVVVNT